MQSVGESLRLLLLLFGGVEQCCGLDVSVVMDGAREGERERELLFRRASMLSICL